MREPGHGDGRELILPFGPGARVGVATIQDAAEVDAAAQSGRNTGGGGIILASTFD